MKQIVTLLIAVAFVAGLSGCCGTGGCGAGMMAGSCYDNPANCAGIGPCAMGGSPGACPSPCATGACGGCDPIAARGGYGAMTAYAGCPTGCGGMGGCSACEQGFTPGPTGMGSGGGAVAYPYYTNRGPRDFLAINPRSIGP